MLTGKHLVAGEWKDGSGSFHSATVNGTDRAYSSGTAMQPAGEWKKSAARIRQLDEMAKRLRELEKQLAADARRPAHLV